jgi:redox-sensitive bicupin YhaK (pirin superfamily)
MLFKRPSLERGHANQGWLDSYFTFSFAEYFDPKHHGFSVLRVINEDRIQGGSGFGTHPHKDMEIITYVMEGAIEHKDSLGQSTVIYPGEVQRMTAGSGIAHSEFNHFKDQVSHLLQIWIFPKVNGLKPGYEQKSFKDQFASQEFTLVASQSGKAGSLMIHQDVELHVACLGKGKAVDFPIRTERSYWIQICKGQVSINGEAFHEGDGLGITNEKALKFATRDGVEFLLFDLPAK